MKDNANKIEKKNMGPAMPWMRVAECMINVTERLSALLTWLRGFVTLRFTQGCVDVTMTASILIVWKRIPTMTASMLSLLVRLVLDPLA